MRSVEILAKLLIVIFILSWGVQISVGYILPQIDPTNSIKHITELSSIRFVLKNSFQLLTQIVVGLWLALMAKKSRKSPWIWGLFGLTYGLIAAVLYYCASYVVKADFHMEERMRS